MTPTAPVAATAEDAEPSASAVPAPAAIHRPPGEPDAGTGAQAGRQRSALGGWGDPTGALATLGLDPRPDLRLGVAQSVVVSAGGMTILMGFMFFGKRRRDGEPTAPDEVLEAAAASASTEPADAALATPPPPPLDPDLAMPRWRRPSLMQARKADPLRDVPEIATMKFGDGAIAPMEGFERRLVRYHMVELLDAPDELRSTPVGVLTQGDEVQLLERSGGYWRVLCPSGQEGWIHRMTLGTEVGTAPPPGPVETWALPPEPTDAAVPETDLFAAFVAARQRAEA